MILYINACARTESRTNRLAKVLLGGLGDYVEIKLNDLDIRPLNEERLRYRNEQIGKKNYGDKIFDLSKQFAAADIIVMAAPYWDGSFPAVLKTYIENIYCTGIVTKFDEKGCPRGLCRGQKMYYVTTAGGKYNRRFSYDYLESMMKDMFGIKECALISAEFLDIEGNDAEAILTDCEKSILNGMR